VLTVSPEAQASLQAHTWPGNVRELENVVLRAVVLCVGDVITTAHLMFDEPAQAPAVPTTTEPPSDGSGGGSSAGAFGVSGPALPQANSFAHGTESQTFIAAVGEPTEAASLQQAVQLNEHQLIMSAIQSTLSRLEAARKLGISPRTLRYKIAKLRESGLALSA